LWCFDAEKRVIGDFMFYKDRTETNLLQLFAHPETSEMASEMDNFWYYF